MPNLRMTQTSSATNSAAKCHTPPRWSGMEKQQLTNRAREKIARQRYQREYGHAIAAEPV